MGGGEAVYDVVVVHEHVADARERQTRQSEILPRHAISRRVLAARPQQERQHQAEGERDIEQGLLIGSVDRQPGVDVVHGHCDRDHADDQTRVARELAHWTFPTS
jgi:hypothetical protein